ncbi:hypothetical protein EPR50_G00079210 [Perca flavescens]|uniref:Uncharacterized protein n=1 Tax=Perca flavescens TaxID=8167 RepID=A0A484D6L3_PERFV|nr:hypothetical protein EPR50_G00079210 [Perca flavescens]
MSNDRVTRPRTRKTCEIPPAFVLLRKRGRRERERERERGEQRGELSILPTRTGILWTLHVSGLSTHWQREHSALSGRPDNHAKPTPVFRRTTLYPVSLAKELVSTKLPQSPRTNL